MAFGPALEGSSRKGIRVQFICAHCGLPHEADWSLFEKGSKSQACIRAEKCVEYQTLQISAMPTSTLKSIFDVWETEGRTAAAERHGITPMTSDFASRKYVDYLLSSVPAEVQEKLHALAYNKSGVHFDVLATGELGQTFDLSASAIRTITRRFEQRLKAEQAAKDAELAAHPDLSTIVCDMQCAVLEAAENPDGVLDVDGLSFNSDGTVVGRYATCNDQVGRLVAAGFRDVATAFVEVVERTREFHRGYRKARKKRARKGATPVLATHHTFDVPKVTWEPAIASGSEISVELSAAI
jgi:hypothetical protein